MSSKIPTAKEARAKIQPKIDEEKNRATEYIYKRINTAIDNGCCSVTVSTSEWPNPPAPLRDELLSLGYDVIISAADSQIIVKW